MKKRLQIESRGTQEKTFAKGHFFNSVRGEREFVCEIKNLFFSLNKCTVNIIVILWFKNVGNKWSYVLIVNTCSY